MADYHFHIGQLGLAYPQILNTLQQISGLLGGYMMACWIAVISNSRQRVRSTVENVNDLWPICESSMIATGIIFPPSYGATVDFTGAAGILINVYNAIADDMDAGILDEAEKAEDFLTMKLPGGWREYRPNSNYSG